MAASQRKNNSLDAATKKHLEKLTQIKQEISNKTCPISQENQTRLLNRINQIEQVLKKKDYNSNQVVKQVSVLNEDLMKYRHQYVEAKKNEITAQIDTLVKNNLNDLELLKERTESLESHAVQFKRQSKNTKSFSFSSLFKCFPCCGGEKENQVNSEHSRLLGRK